jgi:serine/threonine protein kinase
MIQGMSGQPFYQSVLNMLAPFNPYQYNWTQPRVDPSTIIRSNTSSTNYEITRTLRELNAAQAGIVVVRSSGTNREYIAKYTRGFGQAQLEGEVKFLKELGKGCLNIIGFQELIHDARGMHMIVEYMPAGDLLATINDHVRRQVPFSEHQIWNVLKDIANALRFLETGQASSSNSTPVQGWKPILHGDIKPDNIAYAEGIGWKLIDFGVAAAMNTKFDTRRTGYLGTIYWIPPEWPAINGLKGDMFALGVVVHQLATFDFPRDLRDWGRNGMALQNEEVAAASVRKHDIARVERGRVDNIPWIVRFRPGKVYSSALADIMGCMLMESPVKRPSAVWLYGWCEEYYAVIRTMCQQLGISEWDEVMQALDSPQNKRGAILRGLQQCVNQEQKERARCEMTRDAGMIFAAEGGSHIPG